MKIAPPIHLPMHLPPVALPQGRVTTLPVRPAPTEGEETAQGVAEKDGKLAQQGQTSQLREQMTGFSGLKSRDMQLLDRKQGLTAQYAKRVSSDVRDMRKRLKGRTLLSPEAVFAEILEESGGNWGRARDLLGEAARQALDDGEHREHQLFHGQLESLLQRFNRQRERGLSIPTRRRTLLRADAPFRAELEAVYSAATSGPLSFIGLVDALLEEKRKRGDFEPILRAMRSDMAAHLGAAVASSAVSQSRPLMTGLKVALQVTALLGECEHLLGRMRRKNPDLRIEAIALLRHLMTLIGTLMEPEQTRTLVELIGGKHLRNQLACLNELKRILNERLPRELLRTKTGFTNPRDNLLILSTMLTNEEQQLAQENSAQWNA